MNKQPSVRRLHALLPNTVRTAEEVDDWIGAEPVSYTHLTLPTICSV